MNRRDRRYHPRAARRGPNQTKPRAGAEADDRITQEGARARLERAYGDRPDGWETRRARRNDLSEGDGDDLV